MNFFDLFSHFWLDLFDFENLLDFFSSVFKMKKAVFGAWIDRNSWHVEFTFEQIRSCWRLGLEGVVHTVISVAARANKLVEGIETLVALLRLPDGVWVVDRRQFR